MQVVKYIFLFMLLLASTYIGILISKKFTSRTNELKEMKNALNMLSTKIKFTYEPLPKIFLEISEKFKSNIGDIFGKAYQKMNDMVASEAWTEAIQNSNTNLNDEDKKVIQNLSNLLGQVDLEGQISEIKLVDNFLNVQIEKAEEEKKKSAKMYKILGLTIGIAIAIVLI